MSGQDAVNSAKAFNEQLELDGLILTKFDSDTRGGALLSAKMVTGKPSNFSASAKSWIAWKNSAPRAWPSASWAWVTSSAWSARRWTKFDQEETARLQAKMEKGQFTLDDFMAQMARSRSSAPWAKSWG
jgi:signal recognition particle subunit SRP54